MGGLLFGYDWVVIGGAKPFYEAYFAISDNPSMQGLAMSIAIAGCLVGAMVSGFFADRYGRKPFVGVFGHCIPAVGIYDRRSRYLCAIPYCTLDRRCGYRCSLGPVANVHRRGVAVGHSRTNGVDQPAHNRTRHTCSPNCQLSHSRTHACRY